MTEQECLAKMVAPGTPRQGKWRQGVIQIHVTRACDNACFHCTQGSNLGGRLEFITLENFTKAVDSLRGYFGVVGIFGGNPALHPDFPQICRILRERIPKEQCGLWCNNPHGHGKTMRETFNPAHSNLNVHLNQAAYDEFKRDWPESIPFGLKDDSRHSPCYVAMKDVLWKPCPTCGGNGGTHSCGCDEPDCNIFTPCETCHNKNKRVYTEGHPSRASVYDEERAYDLISRCDINQHWSAMIGQFRGEVRAWFCEIAGAQAMLHQHDPDYPDTGMYPDSPRTNGALLAWWQRSMYDFARQVRKHCHECGVPLRGHGELAMGGTGKEQCSKTHESIYKLKRKGRELEVVTELVQLGTPLSKMTNYIGNAKE